MDIRAIEEKLNKIRDDLNLEADKMKDIAENIRYKVFDDPRDEFEAKQNYYAELMGSEQRYQKANDEYHDLISGFSDAYLEMSSFYVGPDLPRHSETSFLDSKEDMKTLYIMFFMSLFLK
jgi:hypothetical protein|tara:strand:- start:72 stop:431 length:360 start_codon:yes stop_codon:yes gene_type:complete